MKPCGATGVYRCGFARSQEAHDEAINQLFASLSTIEERLGTSRFVSGNMFTWLDLRLFHTLVRFDPVCESSPHNRHHTIDIAAGHVNGDGHIVSSRPLHTCLVTK
jgi:glutathionyl-hydroquinone reductase